MKTKLFTLLFSLLVCSSLMAQNDNHMKFKEISINGNIITFGSQLKSQGFTQNGDSGIFKGQFAGDDCTLAVYETKTTKVVYQVIVVYNTEGDSWYTIKSDYKKLRDLYRSKYGKPTTDMEKFISPYYEGDGYELSAIRLGKCYYLSTWELPNGDINIGISEDTILISYEDRINSMINEEEDKDQAYSDI